MGGTPVVTTPVGAEGLDLVQGEHALIGPTRPTWPPGITRLLTDDDLWHRLADGRRRPRRTSATASTWWSGASPRSSRRSWTQPPQRRGAAGRDASAGADTDARERAVRRRLADDRPPRLVVLVARPAATTARRPPVPAVLAVPAGAGRRLGRLRARRRSRGDQPPRGAARAGRALLRAPDAGVQLAAPLSRAVRAPRDACLRVHQDEHLVVWDIAATRPTASGSTPRRRPGARASAPTPAHRTGPPPDLRRASSAASSGLVGRADAGGPTPTSARRRRARARRRLRRARPRRRDPPRPVPRHAHRHAGHPRRRSAAAHPHRAGRRRARRSPSVTSAPSPGRSTS